MTSVLQAIEPAMTTALGVTSARSVFRTLPASVHQAPGTLDLLEVRELLSHLETSGRLFAAAGRAVPSRQLRDVVTAGKPAKTVEQLFTIASDTDVLVVQRATQQLTRGFFGVTDCVRLATAVSELARNIYMYAQRGTVSLSLTEESTHYRFDLVAEDRGPGIANLDVIMRGDYRSRTGLGRGLIGTKALLDQMEIESGAGRGTRITGRRRARKS